MRSTQRALAQVEQRIGDLSKPAIQPPPPQMPAPADEVQPRKGAAPDGPR
jgi:hypothetical protein